MRHRRSWFKGSARFGDKRDVGLEGPRRDTNGGRKVGFTENTAARHRRGGGREVTVTSKLHTQEYRDIELNIVVVGFTMGFTRDHCMSCIERKVGFT